MRTRRVYGWAAALVIAGCGDSGTSPECIDGNRVVCECPGGGGGEALCVAGRIGACVCANDGGLDGGLDAAPDSSIGRDVGAPDAMPDVSLPDASVRECPAPYGVRASTFGYDAANATAAFQAALRSDEPAIIIDGDEGSTWLVDPSRFVGLTDKTIFIEEGVTVQARPGQFDETSAMLFRCTDCTNVEVYGCGATFRMLRDEEFNAEDMPGEWRHSFGLYGADGFRIQGLRIENSGGDAIYVAGSTARGPSQDVEILDVTVDGARRQGISVISVDGLSVDGFSCRDVQGRYPMAGIDFEPNTAEEHLTRIVLNDVRLENNGRTGILFALARMDQTSTPIDITIRNLYLHDNWLEEAQYEDGKSRSEVIVSSGPRGHIAFENVYVDGSQQGFMYNRSDANSIQIDMTNVVARDLNSRADSWNPIGLEVRNYADAVLPMGNMSFTNFHISTMRGSPLFQVRGSSHDNELRDLTGEIVYMGAFDPLIELINLEGESNYTLTFREAAAAFPTREAILGW